MQSFPKTTALREKKHPTLKYNITKKIYHWGWANNDRIVIFSWTIPLILRDYITPPNCLQWGLYTEVFQVRRNLKWPLKRCSWGRTVALCWRRRVCFLSLSLSLSLTQTLISTWLSIIRHCRELLGSLRESFLFLWCALQQVSTLTLLHCRI